MELVLVTAHYEPRAEEDQHYCVDHSRPSETVIVVEPAKPEEVAWLNVAAQDLSPWEEGVVNLVVRGFSTARRPR